MVINLDYIRGGIVALVAGVLLYMAYGTGGDYRQSVIKLSCDRHGQVFFNGKKYNCQLSDQLPQEQGNE